MIAKKGDGSQVKESTDSSTTIEDDDVCKGELPSIFSHFVTFLLNMYQQTFVNYFASS